MALVKPYPPPREVITPPDHMSYSSLSSYAECGERWRLERGHHYSSGTWWATLAGSAIHKATELIDRKVWDGAELVEAELDIPPFAEMFGEEIRKAQDKGEEIKASGRKLKVESENGGPNKKDRDWWYRWGPEFISRWVTFRACHPTWNVATIPDKNGVASPGIELRLDIDMEGQKVLGFIDRVFECDGEYMVFDLKTGAVPPGALQLVTYGWGLEQVFGLRAQWGYFWTPTKDKEGTLSDPIDIRGFSYDRIATMYQMARQGIEAGIFLPHITNMCAGCGVKDVCWAYHSNPVDPGSPLRSEVEVGKLGEDNRMLTERQNIIDMAKNAEDK